MKLTELLNGVEVKKPFTGPQPEITAVCHDSRKVAPGCVFVCIPGTKIDGHNFAQKAEEAGAAAIVAERPTGCQNEVLVENSRRALSLIAQNFYGNPAKKLRLLGVTGTNGKTTTTYLLKEILEDAGHKVGLIGTNQNMIGDRAVGTVYTTPEPVQLQELLAEMAGADCEFVVMEVSSHSLEQHRVDGLHFEVAIFTNLTQDHLDLHGTMEAYGRAKARLFTMCDTGVLNLDDPYTPTLRSLSTCKVVTYSADDNAADVVAKNSHLKSDRVEFEVVSTGSIGRAELHIPGKFSVYNALGVITASLQLGIPLPRILDGLRRAKGVKGRAEVVPTGRDFTILIDYAHSPDGLQNILTTVRGFAKGRVVCLFGCGGDRDKTKRPKMGAIAAKLSDYLIVTSDNPRTEDPAQIIQEILPGLEGAKTPYIVIENRQKAIHYAVYNAQKDDIIVLAGKGHETYQILGTERVHFDEREIVRQALQESEK